MNIGRSIAGAANDTRFTGPDDAFAAVVTAMSTGGYGQEMDYVPNHATNIVGAPEENFQATITFGETKKVVSVPTVYLGENPLYSSVLTGLEMNQGYLKGAVIAIEIGILYEISNMKLDLSDDEKTKLIKDNVNAFLEQERARMEEYIENIQKQDIVSRDQKQQIEVLTETIRRIGVMITAPVIEASKTKVENIMKSDESDQDQEQNNTGGVTDVVGRFAKDIAHAVGFTPRNAANKVEYRVAS